MLVTNDWILIGLAFFLNHWMVQTPQTISKKSSSVEALAFRICVSILLFFVALASATGPFAMFLAVIISLLSNLISFILWKSYYFLVFANNWQDLPAEIWQEVNERHLPGYFYQVVFGLEVASSFLVILTILSKCQLC